jgi:hypothetical protein
LLGDETFLLGGTRPPLPTACAFGMMLERAGGRGRRVGGSDSDKARTREGGAGDPALIGGLREGSKGAALAGDGGPALSGLGGGGGGAGLPGVVGTCLLGVEADCTLLLRGGIKGTILDTVGDDSRGGEAFRCGTAGDGRDGIAGEGREGVASGLEFRRGGGRRGGEGGLFDGSGTTRAGRLGAGRLGGAGAGGT